MTAFGQNLAAERARAIAAVEALAAAVEEQEVPTSGRAAIYMRKEAQAKLVLALPSEDPVPTDQFRLVWRDVSVAAAIGQTITARDAATAILAEAARMEAMAGPLDEWRRTRRQLILAAATIAEIRAIDISPESLMAAIAAG